MVEPRRRALEVLSRIDEQGSWGSRLLKAPSGDAAGPDDARGNAFATELVNGVLRRRLWLDDRIAACASRGLDSIDAHLLRILRIAAYQILFLDRVPHHAVVNEAVSMARERPRVRPEQRDGGARFVNAVLRSMVRDGRPPAPADSAGFDLQARYHSFPEPLASRWRARYGEAEAARLFAASNEPAQAGIRPVRSRIDAPRLKEALAAEGIPTLAGLFLPGFLRASKGTPHRSAAFARGEFYIQDEASALVAAMAASASPGARLVLDTCAAPGGKSLLLSEALGPGALVVAADLRLTRLDRIRENLARVGTEGCHLIAADLQAGAPFMPEARFDLVLIDAPCSGTGVLRRHPELRYRFTLEDLGRLAAGQRALLATCAPLVAAGGVLVYSVCSLEPEEGEDQVTAFLAGNPGFTAVDPGPSLPEPARRLVAPLAGSRGTSGGSALFTWPPRDGTDGFFAAVLRRHL